MLKHIYKLIILMIVFVVSIYFFSKDIKEDIVNIDTTIKMSETTFPTVMFQKDNNNINLLHGYSLNMNSNMIREAITTIGEDRIIKVVINENESNIKKIKYELRDINSNDLLDSGQISALDKENNYKIAKLKLKEEIELEEGKEYSLKLMLITKQSKKIYYYTRIKYLINDNLQGKLEYVLNFHNSIMDKDKAQEIIIYLEPNSSVDNSSLSHVNINSSFENISWAGLSPEVVSEVIPTIKEISTDTASIYLSYIVKAKGELYYVDEFYRIRWTESRTYLLSYDRTMEAIFDINNISLSKNELKIGISSQTDLEIFKSDDDNKLCFVRNGDLWYYNIIENKAVRVFSFRQDNTDYIRDTYNQHDIRIINMDSSGNIDFLLYGYMNRGDYEGKVAAVLYRFYVAENRIEELVYIPFDINYDILKNIMDDFYYVNSEDVFYFSIDKTIYAYNIITRKLNIITTASDNDGFVLSEKGKYIAYENMDKNKITIFDLETKEETFIKAGKSKKIEILGIIDTNIIYGYAKESDIIINSDNEKLFPLYKLEIADSKGNILKDYQKSGYYVTDVNVKQNIVELNRVTKTSQGYKEAETDHILNMIISENSSIGITYRITEKALKELYISLSNNADINKVPKVETTINTIITENTSVNIEFDNNYERYYVYAVGKMYDTFDNISDAINCAYPLFGVVINNEQVIVWERSRQTRNEINSFNPIYATWQLDSIGSCIKMMFDSNKKAIEENIYTNRTSSAYKILNENMKATVLNLTGISLEQTLYYISKGNPIFAMKDDKHAVIIKAYDEFNITIIDADAGITKKIGLNDGAKMFEDAGNIFIGYIR